MSTRKKILIVGGGSSGWMSAILIAKSLPEVEVTLVESSDIPIIGVGESTNMTMNRFLSALKLEEKPLMRACNAAFKLAIRFENFNHLGGVFYHPLGFPVAKTNPTEEEFNALPPPFSPNADIFFTHCEAADGNLFSSDYTYSYQVDAGLLGEYLKGLCKAAGNVRHVLAEVQGAELDANGDIAHVRTKEAGLLQADLYIDCTGFRSLLMGTAMREPFESSSHLLLNDRAIAARVPYIDKERELVTYTNCTALSSGWVWSIPLWNRLGTGYVYSSSHLSRAEAEEEFRRHLGVERVRELQFNHLDVRVGRHRRAWVGNCVAIGISYGFLEPLESTGLSLTQVAIRDLTLALGSKLPLERERDMYNLRQQELFDSTRDFIVAHYVVTARDDTPYWRQIRELPLPESLVQALGGARYNSYHTLDGAHRMYRPPSWNTILSGMDFFGTAPRPAQRRRTNATNVRNHAQFLSDEIHGGHADEGAFKAIAAASDHPTWYPINEPETVAGVQELGGALRTAHA